jgi:hypothetical protein
MDDRVGDEEVGDEPERDRCPDGQGGIGNRTGQPKAARSAEGPSKVATKVPQIVTKTYRGRPGDPREHRAERGHGHDPGRVLTQGEQAVHRSTARFGGGRWARLEDRLTVSLGGKERG